MRKRQRRVVNVQRVKRAMRRGREMTREFGPSVVQDEVEFDGRMWWVVFSDRGERNIVALNEEDANDDDYNDGDCAGGCSPTMVEMLVEHEAMIGILLRYAAQCLVQDVDEF